MVAMLVEKKEVKQRRADVELIMKICVFHDIFKYAEGVFG
jgi:hypothetical protein